MRRGWASLTYTLRAAATGRIDFRVPAAPHEWPFASQMRDGVVAGAGLTEPLRGSRVFPPLVVEIVGVGEETGALDKLLARGAVYLDRDVDYALKNLSTALEPILLVILGVGILFTALAVFLPLWNLMNAFRH